MHLFAPLPQAILLARAKTGNLPKREFSLNLQNALFLGTLFV